MKEKKKILLALGVLIGVLSVVGISYAIWQLNLAQTGTNVVTTGCFQVEFTDKNPISLTNAYPILEEDGMELTPYEFTITNTCESEASYQINLEVLNDSTFNELGYIREMLNEKDGTSSSKILTTNSETEKTLENASLAYKLSNGVLAGNESKTFEFRLWLDQDTLAIPSVMNKVLNSKITVITSLKLPVDTTNIMVPIEIKKKYNEVWKDYDSLNSTYTQNEKYELSKVKFESVLNPYSDAVEVVDFSVAQDKSVLGYYVKDSSVDSSSETYSLYIQANGKIKVNPKASYYFFYKYEKTDGIDPIPIDFEGAENLDTSEVTDMSYMFAWSSRLTSLDLSGFDTSKVTDMNHMFIWCSFLTSLDLSSFDTSNVTNMSEMFTAMHRLTSLDISTFDTSNVTDMSGMFYPLSGLTSLDVSHFDTSNVTDMSQMFYGMSSLTSLDLSNFDTSKVTDMSHMFGSMTNLTSLDVSNFDTFNVTGMYGMFSYIESLTSLDLSSFDTSNVLDMSQMFYYSRITNTIYGNHFIRNPNSKIDDMFYEASVGNPPHSSWNGVTFS